MKYGIVSSYEASKYFEECQNILEHSAFSDNKYLFYSVYIFIHIISFKLGNEIVGVYIFQLLLNLLASYSFFQLSYKITNNKAVAFIAVLLLFLTQSFQIWTVYLYSESVYSSLILLFTYCFFVLNQQNIKNLLLTTFILLLVLLSRPTGLLMIPIISIYIFLVLFYKAKYIKASLLAIVLGICFFALLNYAMHSSAQFDFMKPFVEKEVLCYIPTEDTPTLTSHTGSNSLIHIFNYIFHNKKQFIHLSYEKIISFWGMQRYYYSASHNLYLKVFFYPIYFFGAFGLFKYFKQQRKICTFIITLFAIFTISIILTCDDWNNRFNIPIIPFVMMLGAMGLFTSYETILSLLPKKIN